MAYLVRRRFLFHCSVEERIDAMAFFKDKFSALKRDFIVIFKIILSGLTAGFLIFFISALGGTDLKKNTEMTGKYVRRD